MADTTEVKDDAIADWEELLQCPVCYEMPPGQIFQCNEGHHVCGRCKARLDLCPVCRSLFFGTRNYGMEEMIRNVRKLQTFKMGGKMTVTSTSSSGSENTVSADNSIVGVISEENAEEEEQSDSPNRTTYRAPPACKGLFRCLCCITDTERLPAARLLNHLRYYHSSDLIEGVSDNGEYVQTWQIPTVSRRVVIAVRAADMGIFFFIVEMNKDYIGAWVTMAASPWVTYLYGYTITISGNDREAIFTDVASSVRLCEGTLKKNNRCLWVQGVHARALTSAAAVSAKLVLRRTPPEPSATTQGPRAVLRIANRGGTGDEHIALIQGLQDDVARLTRAFSYIGRHAELERPLPWQPRAAAPPRAVTPPRAVAPPRSATPPRVAVPLRAGTPPSADAPTRAAASTRVIASTRSAAPTRTATPPRAAASPRAATPTRAAAPTRTVAAPTRATTSTRTAAPTRTAAATRAAAPTRVAAPTRTAAPPRVATPPRVAAPLCAAPPPRAATPPRADAPSPAAASPLAPSGLDQQHYSRNARRRMNLRMRLLLSASQDRVLAAHTAALASSAAPPAPPAPSAPALSDTVAPPTQSRRARRRRRSRR